MTEEKLLEKIRNDHKDATSHWRSWRKEARECYEMVAGHQITEEDRELLEEELRAAVVFNRIDPMVSSVVGHQINNRHEIRFMPRTIGDTGINEVYTGAAQWADDECDGEDEITDAFWDLVVTGIGVTETRMDYEEDIEGKLLTAERFSPLEILIDPSSRKRNASDARFMIRERWFPRSEAEERWPAIKKIDTSATEVWVENPSDEEPHNAHDAWKYENDASQWYKKEEDQILVLMYQYYHLVPRYAVGDPDSGKVIELSQAKFERLKDQLEMRGIRYVKRMQREYRTAWVAGPKIVENEIGPCPHSFTLKVMTGKRDAKKNVWYGIVRPMIDPQRWSNSFFAEIMDILKSNRSGGAFVEEDALVDPRKAEEQWSSTNPLILVNSGAISNGKIQERNPIQYPVGLDRLMQFAVSAIPEVSGINMELMGMVDRNQPGVIEAQRKRAGMTILAGMFDSLRRHMKERGRVVLYFIDEYISDGRLVRIVGDDGLEKFVPLRKQEGVKKYDIIVAESPVSTNQKEETFQIMMQLLPLMAQIAQAGGNVPPETLDYLPLPTTLTQKWKEMLQPDQQQQQMQQQMQQLTVAEREAGVAKDQSVAQLNQVKAMVEQMEARLNEKLKPFEAVSKSLERAAK